MRNNNDVRLKLSQQIKSASGWISAVGLLSLINSIVYQLLGGDISFLIGLGISQIIDGIGVPQDQLGLVIAVGANAIIAIIFYIFAYKAKKLNKWAFLLTMIIYALDTIIFAYIQDYISFAFHLLALCYIYSGFKACRQLKNLEDEPSIQTCQGEAAAGENKNGNNIPSLYLLETSYLKSDNLYKIYVTEEGIYGARLAGQIYDEQSAYTQILFFSKLSFIKRLIDNRYTTEKEYDDLISYQIGEFLSKDKRNFNIAIDSIESIENDSKRKLWTGSYVNSGVVKFMTKDKRERKFIVIGNQAVKETLERLRIFK